MASLTLRVLAAFAVATSLTASAGCVSATGAQDTGAGIVAPNPTAPAAGARDAVQDLNDRTEDVEGAQPQAPGTGQ